VEQHVTVCVQPKRLAEAGGLEQPEGVAGGATRHGVCSTDSVRNAWEDVQCERKVVREHVGGGGSA
jgi:hypothetical protein